MDPTAANRFPPAGMRVARVIVVVLAALATTACLPTDPMRPEVLGAVVERVGAGPAPAPDGGDRLASGSYRLSTLWEGRTRTWVLHVPDGRIRGVVVGLHGAGGTGADIGDGTGLAALLTARGIASAWPDAVEGSWNDGRPGVDSTAHRERVDDVGFLRTLRTQALAATGASAARVAVVGYSNGAMMAARWACEHARDLRAVVTVGAVGGAHQPAACRPTRPVWALLVAGTADATVPFAGGPVAANGGRNRGEAASVDAMQAVWSAAARCRGTAGVADDAVTVVRATRCRGARVELHRLEGWGHEWRRDAAYDTTARADAFLAAAGLR